MTKTEKEIHAKFKIGTEFTYGVLRRPTRWRVTDIGSRTIIAVNLSEHLDDPTWFNGPPYVVGEEVFDEYDFPALSIII